MSFGIGIGDIVLLSGLAHRLGTTLTSGRKGASAEFQEVQNQLFAIGKALKYASTTIEIPKPLDENQRYEPEDEILGSMIENCGATLKHLDGVLKKYPELRADAETVNEKGHQKWVKDFKDNIRKIKFTTEGTGLDKLRSSLGIHLTALNLAIAARNYTQARNIKLQVEASHEKLEDMHKWFESNIKFASERPKTSKPTAKKAAKAYGFVKQQANDSVSSRSISIITPSEGSELSEVNFEGCERNVSFRQPAGKEELTFFISLKSSNTVSTYLICQRASLNLEWMRNHNSKLFRCSCGNRHELDYTLVPLSIFVRIMASRPTWTIHAFSKASNSVVQLQVSNILSTRLADFEHCRLDLALVQGIRSASTGADPSMLMYTSVQGAGGSLSVLNAQSCTSNFRGVVRSVTINSNRLVYNLDIMKSVQLLHYVSMPFPGPDWDAIQDNPGLLPCRNAEIVIQTKNSSDDTDCDVSQLVVQFTQFTPVDADNTKPLITLKSVNSKASLRTNDRIDILDADIDLTFSSSAAAFAFLTAIESLQHYLFITYLQSQRLEDVVKFHRNIGNAIIREMQLLDAMATMVQDTTTGEERMVISSKCGSKFVTVIVPPVDSGSSPSLIDGPRIGPDVSAFFVDIDTEDTRIVKQSFGTISSLELYFGEGHG